MSFSHIVICVVLTSRHKSHHYHESCFMQISHVFQWNISDYFYQNQEKLYQSLSGDMTVFPDFPGTPNMPPFDKLWMCLYARLGECSFLLIGSKLNCSVFIVLKLSFIVVFRCQYFFGWKHKCSRKLYISHYLWGWSWTK